MFYCVGNVHNVDQRVRFKICRSYTHKKYRQLFNMHKSYKTLFTTHYRVFIELWFAPDFIYYLKKKIKLKKLKLPCLFPAYSNTFCD